MLYFLLVTTQLLPKARYGGCFSKSSEARMTSVERTWPCKRSRVRSGLRSFERLTREGKAGLYAKRKVRTPLHGVRGWVKTEGLNAQYREVLGRYPSEAGVRSVGANGAWTAK